MTKQVKQIFFALMIAAVFSSLVFYSGFYIPFQTTKTFVFLTLVDIALPFYIYLLFQKPELRNIYKNKITIVLLLFMLAMIVSAIFGVDPLNSFLGNTYRKTGVILYLHMGLFSIYITSLFSLSKTWGNHLLKFLIVLGALTGLHGTLEFLRIIPSFYGNDRTAGLFGNPIFFSSFLIIQLFLSLYFAQKTKNKNRFYYYAASFLMLLGILSTGTRGALLGIISGTLVWIALFAWNKTKNKKQLTLIALGTIGGLIALFFITQAVMPQNSFMNRLTNFSGKNVSSRLNYWKIGIVGFKDAPLIGVGTENYYTIADKYFTRDLYATSENWPDKPHNQFVEFLTTIGLIGFGLYLVLLFFLFKILFTSTNKNRFLIAGLVAYIIQNMFVFDTVAAMIVFFLFIGYLNSFNKIRSDSNIKSNNLLRNTLIGLSIIASLLLITNLHYPNTQKDVGILADEYKKEYDQALNSGKSSPKEIDKLFTRSINKYEEAISLHPKHTRYWYGLSRVYLLKAVAEGTPIHQKGIDATRKTIELAPNRIEAQLSEIFILKQNGDDNGALKLAEEIHTDSPNDAEASWVLAGLYYEQNRIDEAAELGYHAIVYGLHINNTNSLMWLTEHLTAKEDYLKLARTYEYVYKINQDLSILPNLAATYAATGNKTKAIETANLLLQKDPSSKPAVEAFIQSIK
jgi:O-antigen ligase